MKNQSDTRKVFTDHRLQIDFERDGYVVVPFLERQDIQRLTNVYYSMHSDLDHGFHATMHSKLVDYRRRVTDEISLVFKQKADSYLRGYKTLVSNFTVKEPGEASFFDFHLDWTMVNEREYVSITIWCPLVDVNERNGNLWVLKGSHKLCYTIRGSPDMFVYADKAPKQLTGEKFEKVALAVSAGTAVIYDHRLFHGSPANLTNERRLAINQAMSPSEVDSWHYCRRDEKRLEIFEVDSDFYHQHIIGTKITGVKSLGILEVEPHYLTRQDIDALYDNDHRSAN